MKLYLFEYTCQSCHDVFKAPQVLPHSYGELLMRSPSGEVVVLNALEDPVYEEVDTLLAQLLGSQGVSAVRRADLLRKVFGIACDEDAQGQRYGITTPPRCPHCGSLDMESWQGTEPPEYVDLDLPAVSHGQWNALNPAQKLDALKQALLALGYHC